MVIHVIGLALISKSVVPVLSGAMERHRFMPTFAVTPCRQPGKRAAARSRLRCKLGTISLREEGFKRAVTYAIPVCPNRGNEARGRPSIPLFPRILRRALDA